MIDYTLIRTDRRSVSIEVKRDGSVVVRAPIIAPKSEIERFVERKEKWIKAKIDECRNREIPNKIAEMSDTEKRELAEKARVILGEKLAYYSKMMGIKYRQMKITSAERRFGSCSSNGTVCFSYRLILYPDEAQNYVVIHELAHFRQMNHSRKFYAIVEKYMPNYRDAEKLLKQG